MAVPARQLNLSPPAEPPGTFVPLQRLRFGLENGRPHQFAPVAWRHGLAQWAIEGVLPRQHHAELAFVVPNGALHLHLLLGGDPRNGQPPFVGFRADENLLTEPLDTSGFEQHLCVDDLHGFGLGLLQLKDDGARGVHIFGNGRKKLNLNGHHAAWHLCIRECPGGPRICAWRDPPSSR